MDQVTFNRIAKLHPGIREEVRAGISSLIAKKVYVRIVQGLRTFEEQDEIFAQGRTKPGHIVTKAKGGQSYHNYGLAFDFCLLHPSGDVSWSMHEDLNEDHVADWMQVVNEFKARGFTWGGDWKTSPDTPHLEQTFGLSVVQCLAKATKQQIDAEKYILIS